MEVQAIRDFIEKLVPLPEPSWLALRALFREEFMAKDEHFSQLDRIERRIAFVRSGVVRSYYLDASGKEYNKVFLTENTFIGALQSLITRQPNQILMQALTDCQLYSAEYQQIIDLFDEHPKLERFMRKLVEGFYLQKERREIAFVLEDATQRYATFRREHPGLENRIAQYHIAAYLGITPTQLSRIRRQLRLQK